MSLYNFLQGGGEMGELTRNFDWSKTSIGAPGTWPQSLRTTLSIILNSKFPMFLFWGPEHICFYNDSYRPSLGNNGKHPAALGMPAETVWPEIWKDIKPLIDQVLQKGEATWSEDQLLPIYRNQKLEDVYWTFSYSPVIEENGNIAGVFITCSETTEKVLLVNKLKASEQQFQNLVNQAIIGIVVLIGEEMRVEIVNDMYGRLISRTTEELLGKNLFDIIPELADPFRALLDSVRITGEPVHLYDQQYVVFPNGEKKVGYVNFVYQPYKDVNGVTTGVIALCQDITEQFNAKEQLHLSEERLHIALDAAGLASFELDYSKPDELLTTEKFNEIFGLEHDVPRHDIINTIHPDDLPIRNLAHAEAFKTGKLFYEIRTLKNDGLVNWIRIDGKVIYDDNGKPEKLLGIAQNITRQKDIQQQKDNFIAMASHELKTPVTSIKAYAQILEEILRKKGNQTEAAMISRLDSQVDRLTNLISDLLNSTRINTGKLEYSKTDFDFNQFITEMAEELQRTTKIHELAINLDRTVTVTADRERLSQVITNFISNAIKYSPGAEVIHITTKVNEGEVVFCVQDFGIGINMHEQDKVFEQFYRVNNDKHQSFQGLGLGLYIAAEIIKREGGKIWVDSVEGKGSEFYFSLPLQS